MRNTTHSFFATAALSVAMLVAGCDQPEQRILESGAADTSAAESLNVLTGAEESEGWTLLFNGEDLDNWQGFQSDSVPAKWVIEDGTLHYDPDIEGSGGDIVTEQSYADFELAFDWKIGQCGNSGVIYRADTSEEYDTPWMTGPEYQLLDNTCNPDAENGSDRTAGANYDMNAPSEDLTRPSGEWNETRIVVDGSRVEHWLNGTKVVEYELGSEDWNQRRSASKWTEYPDYGTKSSGHIALQDHGDPVWFRNIRIREL